LYPYPQDLVIATKGGFDRPGPNQWVENGKPEHLRSACEGACAGCVVLRKLDSTGNEVFVSGYNGFQQDGLAKGWLRASHRELDPARSTPLRPFH
jgi:hypothetical protein